MRRDETGEQCMIGYFAGPVTIDKTLTASAIHCVTHWVDYSEKDIFSAEVGRRYNIVKPVYGYSYRNRRG